MKSEEKGGEEERIKNKKKAFNIPAGNYYYVRTCRMLQMLHKSREHGESTHTYTHTLTVRMLPAPPVPASAPVTSRGCIHRPSSRGSTRATGMAPLPWEPLP